MPDGEIRRTWNDRHGARGFRQVNDDQNVKMQQWIRKVFEESKDPNRSSVLYDLYGGRGNLSLPLVEQMSQIHCVDLSAPVGTPPGTPDHLKFYRSDVAPWLDNHLKRSKKPKGEIQVLAVLDPPREGLAHQFDWIAKNLEKLKVEKVVAVGCDPDSWARDVSRWIKRGWHLERAAAFDFFPQTPHVEAVAFLTRAI